MLKRLLLKKKIEEKRSELEQLKSKLNEFSTREEELATAIDEANTDEEKSLIEEEVEKFDKEKTEVEEKIDNLSKEVNDLEVELENSEKNVPQRKNEPFEKRDEMKGRTNMNLKTQIRTTPLNVRAFDTLSFEQRTEIVAREDVKNFLNQIRAVGKEKRDIVGGELTIPVVFLDLIYENMYRYSKLMNRVRVRNVKGQARQTIAGTVPEAVWTEMCGTLNELNFNFNQLTVDGYKVAGFVPVCNALLEDSDIELAGAIIEMLSESIGYAKDKAIIFGLGAQSHMPLGFVTRLAQTAEPAGYPANAQPWVNLSTTNIIQIDGSLTGAEFWSALTLATSAIANRYARGTKFWAMNSKTLATLQSKAITFTATGAIVAGVTDTLPVVTGDIDILEFLPDGCIYGGYGDLYLYVQRESMVVEYDRSVQFIQDNTVFRGKERADGTPIIAKAFVAININGQAPTTSMAFAGDLANDSALDGLTVGTETLSPTFDTTVTTYNVTATGASATVNADTSSPKATVVLTYNGKQYKNGATITWTTGNLPLTVKVTNGSSTTVYTVNVNKA